jgi:hypothetical protein
MNKSYTDQANRIVRSFRKMPKENCPNRFSDNDWDACYCFFLNAYYLKDWIINDKSNEISRRKINNFIKGSKSLKILQSVANILKHSKISKGWNRYPQVDFVFDEIPKVQYGREDFILLENGGKLMNEDGSYILAESSEKFEIHPKVLAVSVLAEWNKFFQENNLQGFFDMKYKKKKENQPYASSYKN